MHTGNLNRVVFYSARDLSTDSNLKNAAKLLEKMEFVDRTNINDLLEIYHIKLYFDNNLFCPDWSDSIKNNYKRIIDGYWTTTIKRFWISINDSNIIDYAKKLEFNYSNSFWKLINDLKVYEKIDKKIFLIILEETPFHIRDILTFKKIVSHFGSEIRIFLMQYDKSAELLISKAEDTSELDYFFPKCLTIPDKENIIVKYLDSDKVNLNYVRLIEHSKDSDDFKLSARARLKAKKKSVELNSKVFKEGHSWEVGVQVSISKEQDTPIEILRRDLVLEVTYSEKFFDAHTSDVSLFLLFKSLFTFVDQQGIISLFSKEQDLSDLERIFVKSKNAYLKGLGFDRKNILSHLQIVGFNHYLNQKNNSIERLIESFIKEVLNAQLGLTNLRLKFPSKNYSYWEKLRILIPEFESLLKQYQIYSNEGKIDFELIEFDSNPLRLSDIKSLVAKKYVYINSDKAIQLKNLFFFSAKHVALC